MKLGDYIYDYRKKNKMSMDDFAKKSGISKAYISLLEKGKHPQSGKPIIPSLETIKKASAAMNMSFETVLNSIDQDISIEEIIEPHMVMDEDGRWAELYNGFVRLPEVTQEKLLMYFNAIIEAEKKSGTGLGLLDDYLDD